MGDRPTIVRNPAADADFERVVAEIIPDGALDPADAQARLREVYPRAVVRRRELAAERIEVWYVYREGHWVRGD